jgi:hypothetical protein
MSGNDAEIAGGQIGRRKEQQNGESGDGDRQSSPPGWFHDLSN